MPGQTGPAARSALGARASTGSRRDSCVIAQMTLLNCLCAAIPARERVIACQEVFELSKAG